MILIKYEISNFDRIDIFNVFVKYLIYAVYYTKSSLNVSV